MLDEQDVTFSPQQAQVLLGIAQGRPLSVIADELKLSRNTVSTYRHRVLAKLGLRNNAQLIRYAIERKLI